MTLTLNKGSFFATSNFKTMMFTRLNFLTILFLFSYIGIAQTGKISGKITDGKTGEALPGAIIIIDGTTKGASADFDGNFKPKLESLKSSAMDFLRS